MRCRVYRSLDKPSSFFGLRGRFVLWCAGGIGVSLALGLVVGLLTVSLFGMITCFAGAAASYLFVTSLQGKMSDREFSKKLLAGKYPEYVHLKPVPFDSNYEQ